MSDMNLQMASQIFESVKEILEERNIRYEELQREGEGNYAVHFSYNGEDMSHRMFIQVIGERGVFSLQEYLQFAVDPAKADKVVDACNRVNLGLIFGTFYYDYEGSVIFYNPLLFGNSIISKDTIEELFFRTVNICEQYDDRFAAVNKGYLPPEKITDKE